MDNLQALSLLSLTENWGESDLELIYQTTKDRLKNKRMIAISWTYEHCYKVLEDGNHKIVKDEVIQLINFINDFVLSMTKVVSDDFEFIRTFSADQYYAKNYEGINKLLVRYDLEATQDNYLNVLLNLINSDVADQVLNVIVMRIMMDFHSFFPHTIDFTTNQLIINFLSAHNGKNYEKYFMLIECYRYDYVVIYRNKNNNMYNNHIIFSDLNDLRKLEKEKKANEEQFSGVIAEIYQVK